MKTRLIISALILTILQFGCVSQGVSPGRVDDVSLFVRPITKTSVGLVLNKNPGYADAVLALAATADLAMNGANLSPENIKAFMDVFSAKWALDADTKFILASAIDDVATIYRQKYGAVVVEAADPNVKKLLGAFAQGLRDAVAFHRAMRG